MTTGRRANPHGGLSALFVRQVRKTGRHADGNALYLLVDPNGSKRWMLRTVVQGRRRDIGLGSARLVSLAEAREKAVAYRKVAREGGDPMADRKRDTAVALTFAECARHVHAAHAPGWRNPKHSSQWLTTLERYAFPHFGGRPVGQVDSSEVLQALSELWLAKPETARRVRQRIRMVFDYAKAAGHRVGDNPVDGVTRVLPRQTARPKHHTALPYARVPEFIASLDHAIPGEPTRLGGTTIAVVEFFTPVQSEPSAYGGSLRGIVVKFFIAIALRLVPAVELGHETPAGRPFPGGLRRLTRERADSTGRSVGRGLIKA